MYTSIPRLYTCNSFVSAILAPFSSASLIVREEVRPPEITPTRTWQIYLQKKNRRLVAQQFWSGSFQKKLHYSTNVESATRLPPIE